MNFLYANYNSNLLLNTLVNNTILAAKVLLI
jgi:hypothetical protein